jgi:putative ABC transport system permease protein
MLSLILAPKTVITTFRGLMTALGMMQVDFRLALRNILRQRRRSLIALAAIGFGVTAMMLAAGYIEWIFWANREEVAIKQFGHIQVAKPGYHEDGKSDPLAYLLPNDSAARAAIEHAPGVQAVAQRLDFSGLVSHGDSTLSFLGLGIDPVKDPAMRNVIINEGQSLDATDPKGILIGAGLAANLGVRKGDTIVLLANASGGGMRAVEGHIRGLVSITVKAYNDSMLYLPIATARELLGVEGSHLWIAILQQTESTDATVARFRQEDSLANLDVVPWSELADFYHKTVELFSRQIGVVKLVIACIIVLSISNTMTMSVMERTVEIGTAMALGIRRRRILSQFLLEGGLLGMIGGGLGIVVGFLLAAGISSVGIPMPAGPGMAHGFIATIMVNPDIAIEAFAMAILTTLLASLYPAWRASRMVIVDALRHNR